MHGGVIRVPSAAQVETSQSKKKKPKPLLVEEETETDSDEEEAARPAKKKVVKKKKAKSTTPRSVDSTPRGETHAKKKSKTEKPGPAVPKLPRGLGKTAKESDKSAKPKGTVSNKSAGGSLSARSATRVRD